MKASDIPDGASANSVSTISAGITIVGNVQCQGELQISGRVEGDVECPTLFVEESGSVTGGVTAERLRVCGLIDGTVDVGDLAVEPTGTVSGNITYARLKVGAGGAIEGTSKRRAEQSRAADTGPLKLVDPAPAAVNPRRVYVDS